MSSASFLKVLFALLALSPCAFPCSFAQSTTSSQRPVVTHPPESFFQIVREKDRDVAREFYKKYIDIQGIPVAASAEIADMALLRTHDIVSHMLAGRSDIRQAMAKDGMYLIIIGKDQVYTDMPEYRNRDNKAYLNERVRGTGGKPTSFGEENLLSLPVDRYDDESIAVHEFCHTIDSALGSIDPSWRQRKNAVFRAAMDRGLYKYCYTASNAGEYWAEIAQSYFDSNRVNNWNHGPIGTREQLKVYDPEGYELARSIFKLSPENDWRYRPLQELPSVAPPPKKLKIDPFYTKFSWAREFTVLGREASDMALLKANDTVRKMFAYRHDILKALIADGVKLAVLGENESIADLPPYNKWDSEAIDLTARFLDYTPETKLLVVSEENVLGNPADPLVGQNQTIRVFAKTLYHVVGKRPVDPNWAQRPNSLRQQYELRVQRLDVRFDERLRKIHTAALDKGLWKGTAAIHNRVEYWASAVTAYFDATGQSATPNDSPHPIATREALEEYDPDLYELVRETMAYEGHVDWRFEF